MEGEEDGKGEDKQGREESENEAADGSLGVFILKSQGMRSSPVPKSPVTYYLATAAKSQQQY